VAYDGTDFAGFQVQTGERTVQGTLEEGVASVLGAAVRVDGAGRTDAGVHATGQVVSLRTTSPMPAADLRRALNAVLPADLAVEEARDAPPGFHARFSARARTYRYTIWNAPVRKVLGRQYAYHWRAFLDAPAMDAAARGLLGKHDFAAFSGSTRGRERPVDSVRTLYRLSCWRDGSRVHVEATADAFLPHMVRNLVGTLLPVGMGRAAAVDVRRVLGGRDRRRAGRTVPACGLCLTGVWYD
jgi:tRNA pseudouridine38-40 synthase